MDAPPLNLLIDGLIAAGLGLFVGLEREHSDVGGRMEADGAGEPGRDGDGVRSSALLGVRTFALMSLLGWLCGLLEAQVRGVALVGFALGGTLVGVQYVRSWRAGAGITTEVAALVTFGAGLLTTRSRLLAVGLAIGVSLLLISKPWVRRFVAQLERREIMATIQLAIMLAIVLPLLPDRPIDPWNAISPRKVGLFVALIAGINFLGYLLSRVLGARRGAGLSGIVGGLASSTAVTAAMAQRARAADGMITPGQLATFLANVVMFGRVLVVSALLGRGVARALLAPMIAMAGVLLAGAAWKWRALRREGTTSDGQVALENPFALLPALKWGGLLAVILVASAVARAEFGSRGLLVAAAVSGFADVDAINVAVSRQAAKGDLPTAFAALAITVAVLSNTLVKGGIAVASGGWRFGRDVALAFGLAMALGLAAAAL